MPRSTRAPPRLWKASVKTAARPVAAGKPPAGRHPDIKPAERSSTFRVNEELEAAGQPAAGRQPDIKPKEQPSAFRANEEFEAAGQPAAGREPDLKPTEQPFAFHVGEELEDAFDSHGVPTELLGDWALLERKAFTRPAGAGGPLLPLAIREAALQYLALFGQFLGLQPQKWSDAATLLDAYCARAPGGLAAEAVPAACTAIMRLLKKFDDATNRTRVAGLPPHTARLAQCLQRFGCAPEPVTPEQIERHEVMLLQALKWQIRLPSLESWISTFCTRFGLITQGLLAPSIAWIRQHCMTCTRAAVLRRATTGRMLPRQLAIGLLGITFVKAQLLPLECLAPRKLFATKWRGLCGVSQVLPSECEAERANKVLEGLQVAMDASFAELQEACGIAAVLMRDLHTEHVRGT